MIVDVVLDDLLIAKPLVNMLSVNYVIEMGKTGKSKGIGKLVCVCVCVFCQLIS